MNGSKSTLNLISYSPAFNQKIENQLIKMKMDPLEDARQPNKGE
jgi:hypothetical protein